MITIFDNILNVSSGAINYHELIKSSSDNEMRQIDELQTKISPDSPCNIQFSSGTTGETNKNLINV